ncbi:biotin--[acetyl-CoA-carboxylase] ligase [Vaginella massiliensis]|uniref:biotin--[acetyl-CoA-carboxylase] ligase n=1 Tax=Vaginella massiliensis TaxID=1816680 RepID=UPI0008398549|nr:biotin--[acetyl-CoA-carboxylase] ligase [Vaginella massiliensis]
MKFEIQTFETLPSTNSYLTELTKKNAKPWTVIYAKNQTNGKGYAGNVWKVEKEQNLTFSFYLKTSLDFRELIFLNEWISVTLAQFLSRYLTDIHVKWPNDIIASDKKICGILTESYKSNQAMHSIIGIGLNVNQIDFNAMPRASSLKLLTDKTFDLETLLHDLMTAFCEQYNVIDNGNFLEIHEAYQAKLYKKNEWADFVVDGVQCKGCIKKSDEQGQLWVAFEDGNIRAFQHKEIQLIY